MKEWYQSLSERDRNILTYGGGLALFMLGYFVFWDPLSASIERQSQQLKANEQSRQQMQQWATEAKKLKGLSPSHVDTGNRSLISLVDEKIRAAGMKSNLDRMEPEGKDQVRLSLKNSDFDRIITLLGQLHQQYGIEVDSATITPADKPGTANARLNLIRS